MHPHLDQVAVVGELEAAVVDRTVPRDEKLDGSALRIRVEPDVVRLKMVNQHLEWRDRPVGRSFFGYAQHFRQTEYGGKSFACHKPVRRLSRVACHHEGRLCDPRRIKENETNDHPFDLENRTLVSLITAHRDSSKRPAISIKVDVLP